MDSWWLQCINLRNCFAATMSRIQLCIVDHCVRLLCRMFVLAVNSVITESLEGLNDANDIPHAIHLSYALCQHQDW